MDIQSEDFAGAFQLYPMIIPGWRGTVLPAGIAHGGVPQSIYQEPRGLLMVIDPQTTLAQAMAAYDSVVVWLNDEETSVSAIIQPGEEDDRLALYLPPGLLRNGINHLFYRWTRSSGNFEDSRPILDVLYHNPAPGFPAPAGITLIHPVSVGPAEAAQGALINFRVSYPRAFDKVTLTVGTWSRTITVTDPTQPITLTLTAADFQQIGDNPLTPVSARVVDQLGNGNSSATTFMDIHASQVLLEPAVLKEILSENNDDPTIVDLGKMNGGPLWAVVHLIDSVWMKDDEIRLTYSVTVDGHVIAMHEAELLIGQAPGLITWEIPNAKVIADGEIKVSFQQWRTDNLRGISKVAQAKVVGKVVPLPIHENWDDEAVQTIVPMTPSKFKSGLTLLILSQEHPTHVVQVTSQVGLGSRTLIFGSRSIARFSWTGGATKISFIYAAVNSFGNTVSFYKTDGSFVERVNLSVSVHETTLLSFIGIDIGFFEVNSAAEGTMLGDTGFYMDSIEISF
jgi:hypothetical protein